MNSYNYRQIYEKFHNVKIGSDQFGRKHEIHHIDGNHENNDPLNLCEVTIQQHFDIHYVQGDWGACYMMSKRMKQTPEEISKLAKLSVAKQIFEGKNKFVTDNPVYKQLANGTHSFLSGEVQRATQNRLVANGTHHLLSGAIQRKSSMKRLANGTHNFKTKWTCEHCNKNGVGTSNYIRWHGKNCKKICCLP